MHFAVAVSQRLSVYLEGLNGSVNSLFIRKYLLMHIKNMLINWAGATTSAVVQQVYDVRH